MDNDGRNPVNLTDHEGVDGWPVWSPDGKFIAFASEQEGNTKIFVMDSDGKNKRKVTDGSPFDDRQPYWNNDGTLLLFSRYQWFQGNPWYEASEIFITKTK